MFFSKQNFQKNLVFWKKHAKWCREIYFSGIFLASVYQELSKNVHFTLQHPSWRLFWFLNAVIWHHILGRDIDRGLLIPDLISLTVQPRFIIRDMKLVRDLNVRTFWNICVLSHSIWKFWSSIPLLDLRPLEANHS